MILGVAWPRVSDVINKKALKFTEDVDALIDNWLTQYYDYKLLYSGDLISVGTKGKLS